MNEYIRTKKVEELNRLLPMIRETIKKEKLIDSLHKKLNRELNLLEKVNESLKDLDMLPELLDEVAKISNNMKDQIKELQENLQKRKKNLEDSLKNLKYLIFELTKENRFEVDLYKSIISALIIDQIGFMKIEDLKEDYLEEYLYLLIFDSSYSIKLNVKNLFVNDKAKSYFFDKLNEKNYTNVNSTFLNAVENQTATKDMYYNIF